MSPVNLGFDGKGGRVSDLSWFAERGFGTEAQTVMTATEVHEPAHRGDGAVYRLVSSDEDWEQCVQLGMRCNDRSIEPASYRRYLEARVGAHRRLTEAGHGGWFGAFVDGRLVSQLGLFCASPGLARFQSVETDPALRRQGLAGSLLHYATGWTNWARRHWSWWPTRTTSPSTCTELWASWRPRPSSRSSGRPTARL